MMNRAESEALIEELNAQVLDLKVELNERPEKIVREVHEVVIENSSMGGDIGLLAGALSRSQSEFTAVHKGTKAHKYNYADIEAVLKASTPIYTEHGLAIVQMNVSKMQGRTPLVGVKTILSHSGGGWIAGEVYLPVAKTKMNTLVQMAGVTITYLRRYGIQSALGLATTDSDGSDN